LKRWLSILLLFAVMAAAATAEEANPPLSFGMQFVVEYNILSGSFNLWDFRYGLGVDFMVHLGSAFYLGLELGASFGFHKALITDQSFNRIYVQFPIHLCLTAFFSGFNAQIYGGASYNGEAALNGGMLYGDDFSFRLLPEAGVKVGWGTINNIFLKAGYVFEGYVYFGIGARLGLF
jgi:hypothetical protein